MMMLKELHTVLNNFIENRFDEVFSLPIDIIVSTVHDLLTTNFNTIFKVSIVPLNKLLCEESSNFYGETSLILIEPETVDSETNLKYFAVVFENYKPNTKNEPVPCFFLSELMSEGKTRFCQISNTGKELILERYNLEMNDSTEGFINSVAGCLDHIEFYNETITKTDDDGKEKSYLFTGLRYYYDRLIFETITL